MSKSKNDPTVVTEVQPLSAPPNSLQEGAGTVGEVAAAFFKLGVIGYGGPAIFGLFQAELQERKKWLSKERFLEGLALVHALPGAAAIQFCIYAGYQRAGLWGGTFAGLAFMLPGFAIMLMLAMLHEQFGGLPMMRNAFYGLAPAVLAIFVIATYRLGKTAIKDKLSAAIGVAAAAVLWLTPLGVAGTLLLAGSIGLFLKYSRKVGGIAVAAVLALAVAAHFFQGVVSGANLGGPSSQSGFGLLEIGAFFLKVGALTFGGGITVLAFVQDQVVNQMHWVSSQEFLDGLTLGQFTPGPILMLAAFIGYKLAGVAGAAVAAVAIFLPSFLLMLVVLPMLSLVRQSAWVKAAMDGISPAVVGVIGVSFVQLFPHAAPDLFTTALLVVTVGILLRAKVPIIPLLVVSAIIGMAAKAGFS